MRRCLYFPFCLFAITARYHDNPLLAGVCLIGTVKQRITKNMDSRRKQLALLGYKGAKLDSIIKKESRTAISNLVDELRVMNQDGMDMYKKNKGSGAEYSSQEEYNRYFDEELKKAKKKCGH